ncbi:MAG: M24 family metallopeptidase [Acidobacteria bacterium]|nr:M24 family metallopeptidase [Acidobacteriota bacterium]MCI0719633.1 M24 family metallopeptidase [Acidobacteriota bacterium]
MIDIREVQDQLSQAHIDGWLLYDFQGLNPIAKKLVGLQGGMLTRRWYYWIPKQGEPCVLCHRIEQQGFAALNTRLQTFKSWQEMVESLKQMLEGHHSIAMEYSPLCSIPYVSRVDAGTVEAVESLGKKVISSADLVQYFQSRWSGQQFEMHQEAGRLLMSILFETFHDVGEAARQRARLTEYAAQQAMLEKFHHNGLTTFSPPIVAVNQNSGNPHYEPAESASAEIRRDDLLLVDLWAKLDKPESVYADYTWVAYLGKVVPEKIVNVWQTVSGARDAAVAFVKANYPSKKIQGWQVDTIARDYIAERGFSDFFIHRTGHNIGEDDHGTGANMDSLETKDERHLIAETCFSIEPGIYLAEFGIRSEVNVYLEHNDVVVTGDPIQTEIHRIDCS